MALGARADAAQASEGRVVVVTIDAVAVDEVLDPTWRSLYGAFTDGASALVATRTLEDDPSEARLAAYASIGEGARADATFRTTRPLTEALDVAGVTPTAVVPAGDDSAARAAFGDDAIVIGVASDTVISPTGSVVRGERAASIEVSSRVHLITFSDMAAYEDRIEATEGPEHTWIDARRGGSLALVLSEVDDAVEILRAGLGPDDTLIVMTTTTPRARGRVQLGVLTVVGDDVEPGVLSSPTTRRRGLVAIADVAPTILDRLGEPSGGFEGRAVQTHPSSTNVERLGAFAEELIGSAQARHRLTRSTLYTGIGMVLLAGLLIGLGRGRSSGTRGPPRTARDLVGVGLLIVVAAPLALLLEPLTPATATWMRGVAVIAIAGGLALFGRTLIGVGPATVAIAGLTIGVVVIDLLLGTPLAARATLSFAPTAAARFWGLGNEVLGVGVATTLLAAGAALDRSIAPARWRPVVAVGLVVVIVAMGAPQIGGNFGATLTSVSAFAVFAALITDRRVTIRLLIAIGVLAVLVTLFFAYIDSLAAPADQGHVGRAVSDGEIVFDTLERKVRAAWSLITSSIWTVGALVFVGVPAAIWLRARDALPRALFGRPHLRAAWWATLAGAVVATGTNDSGIVSAALAMMVATSAVLAAALAPET